MEHKFSAKESFLLASSTLPLSNLPPNPLNSRLQDTVKECWRLSMTEGAWNSYDVPVRHALRIAKKAGITIKPPFTDESLSVFVSYMLTEQKVTPATIENYLSALLKWSIADGHPVPTLRTEYIKAILAGAVNKRDAMLNAGLITKVKRRAITLALLEYFGSWVSRSTFSELDKQLLWTLATVAFFGAFRIGELLSKTATTFDDSVTLLLKNVTPGTVTTKDGKVVRKYSFLVKSPKVKRSSDGDVVSVYQLTTPSGQPHPLCPVAALDRYVGLLENKGILTWNEPMFKLDSGNAMTKVRFNKILKEAFLPFCTPESSFSCHSFRAGATSHMEDWGFTAEEIRGHGRWSSACWELYSRFPIDRRLEIAVRLGQRVMAR